MRGCRPLAQFSVRNTGLQWKIYCVGLPVAVDGQPDSSGPRGGDTRRLRRPSPSILPGSPCILLAASLQGECADTGAPAGARTPPGRLCSPRILHLFCFSGARMGTRCTLSTCSSLQPPTEVPYVSVMNRHEAWGLGSGSCQSLATEWTRELAGWRRQSCRVWRGRVWIAVVSGHLQHPEGLSKSKSESPKVQAVMAQSPPSLWLIMPAEGLVHFIWDDDSCPGLQESGPGLHLPEQGRESNLARGAVGHLRKTQRPPQILVGCQSRTRILLVAASVLLMVPCIKCATACL